MFLLKLFSSRGFIPTIVRKGPRIVLLIIEEVKLRILSSTHYIEGNEYDLAKHFNLVYEEIYFPCNFLGDINYEGNVPNFSDFIGATDSETIISQKLDFYRSICLKKWNFKKELFTYLTQKLMLLTHAMLIFLHESFSFQSLIKAETGLNHLASLNPFNGPICTLGGFIYRVFKFFYLNQSNIYIVKHENGRAGRNSSRLEHQWASYLDFTQPEKKFVFQKYFLQAVPDLYSPVDGLCVFINGCFFHCCMSTTCTINRNKGPQSLNRDGKTFEQVNNEFDLKLKRLIENNEEITQIDIIWECQIREKMKNDLNFSNFLSTYYNWAPLERLIPRKCFRGAYVDTYLLKWSKIANLSDKCYHLDVNGLYGFISMKNEFMIGKYEVLMGHNLTRLTISSNNFFVDGELVMGAAQVSIIPPQNLKFPFLMYRAQNGQTFNTLCKLCCENFKTKCTHTDQQRTLIGCYMLSELSYALQLNYVLVHIFECHVYKQKAPILTNFVKILTSFKTRHSNLFQTKPLSWSIESYCEYLSNKMELDGALKITPENASNNSSKRLFYKLAQNSFFGKFGQKSNPKQTLFITDQSQIDTLISGNENIHDIFLVNENLCIAEVEKNLKLLAPNRSGNCYIASQITAFSREFIHRAILSVDAIPQSKIILVDCDSLMFTLPETTVPPFMVSDAVGDFKNETDGKILSFFSLGPKNYLITSEKDNEIQVKRKLSGLCLSHAADIDAELYENFLNDYAKNIFASKRLTQAKKKLDFAQRSVTINNCSYLLTNNVSKKRNVNKFSPELLTYPYGFKE